MDGPRIIPYQIIILSFHTFKIQAIESFVVIMKPIHHKDPSPNIFQFPEQSTKIINQPSGRKLASKYTGQIDVPCFVSIRAITDSGGLRK
jgi:hypothetical protein